MNDSASDDVRASIPIPGMHVLKLVEKDGKSIEFYPHDAKRFKVEPLGFEQLTHAAVDPAPTIHLTINNAQAPSASTGLAKDGPLTIRATLAENGSVLAYGLIPGGWAPMPWAHRRVAWLDRNVVIQLEKLGLEGRDSVGRGDPGWLTKVLGLDTEEVSPIPFILEGRGQRPPTDFAMRAELSRAMRVLRGSLPDAKVATIDAKQRRALHRYLLERSVWHARSTRFLMKAAPWVAQPTKASDRLALERKILELAAKEAIPVKSLPVVALLSCLYDNNPALPKHRVFKPGRAVLKPSMDFGDADAYNALADMSFIELLWNAEALTPDVEPVLYTQDVGIAAFWTALQASGHVLNDRGRGIVSTTVHFSLTSDMFPALTGEQVVDLCQRLEAWPASAA